MILWALVLLAPPVVLGLAWAVTVALVIWVSSEQDTPDHFR